MDPSRQAKEKENIDNREEKTSLLGHSSHVSEWLYQKVDGESLNPVCGSIEINTQEDDLCDSLLPPHSGKCRCFFG